MTPRISSWSMWSNIPSTDTSIKSSDNWIKAHQQEDGAEGLWRVHNGLYDLRKWIHKHPGGPQWLEITKGTDITDLFETYHLNGSAPAKTLHMYYVREAKTPRQSPFTFEPNGFYSVLKSRVAEKLNCIEGRDNLLKKSMLIVDSCFLIALALCVTVARTQNLFLAVLTGTVMGMGTVASHNFVHLKDNWRMYYFQLGMMSVREWRIAHVLSHHVYTNTVQDLEMTLLHPFIHWFPTEDKPFTSRFTPYLTLLVYPYIAPGQFCIRTFNRNNEKADLLICVIPIVLMLCGSMSIFSMFGAWYIIILTNSFVFAFFGFISSHHYPDSFHDGDYIKDEKIDWGLHQMNTIVGRNLPINNIFVASVTFGDHILHHLFPSLDHSLIRHIQYIYEDTCKEFGLELVSKPFTTILNGQIKQLMRVTPNNPNIYSKQLM